MRTVLLVASAEVAGEMASAISKKLNLLVELAPSRRAGLAALRRNEYVAVVLDAALPESEVTTSEDLWRNAGRAVPLELPLKEMRPEGVARLARHVLRQCQQAEQMARQGAAAALEERLRSALTGLLLQSDLLLRDAAELPLLNERAHELRKLTEGLRHQLQ